MLNKKTIFSLIFYILGTMAILCSDFYVSKSFDENYIVEWATLKSIIFIFGGICIFGFDQIFVRKPELFSRIIKRYILQCFIVSLFLGFILSNFFIKDFNFIVLSLIIFQYALTQSIAAKFRGNGDLVEAQFFTNGWKIFTLAYLIFGINNPTYVYIYSFISILFLGSYLFFKSTLKDENYTNEVEEYNYKIGFFFLLNSFTLTMATYGEQFLINIYGNKNLSLEVFNYILAFNSLILVFVGFLGFYVVPKLKNIKKVNEAIYKKYMINFSIIGLFLCIFSLFFGSLVFEYYLNIKIDFVLAIFCLISAYIKVIYIIPSAGVSLYCNQSQVKKISFFNIGNLILFLLGFFILMNYVSTYTTHFVFLIISLHWLLRLLNTHKFVIQSLREKNV